MQGTDLALWQQCKESWELHAHLGQLSWETLHYPGIAFLHWPFCPASHFYWNTESCLKDSH